MKIDNHLSWKAHIDDLASNLSKLTHIKNIQTTKTY
jgi:hypothetical protein